MCDEGCTMTWRRYLRQNSNRSYKIHELARLIYRSVYEHPHLSNSKIIHVYGETLGYPIHWIVNDTASKDFGVEERIKALNHIILHGANVNQTDRQAGEPTPLLITQNIELIHALMMSGADPKITGYCGSILSVSVWRGNADLIRSIWHYPEIRDLIHAKTSLSGDRAYDIIVYRKAMAEENPDVAAFLRDGTVPGASVKRAR